MICHDWEVEECHSEDILYPQLQPYCHNVHMLTLSSNTQSLSLYIGYSFISLSMWQSAQETNKQQESMLG
jgi:hypothetical protein